MESEGPSLPSVSSVFLVVPYCPEGFSRVVPGRPIPGFLVAEWVSTPIAQPLPTGLVFGFHDHRVVAYHRGGVQFSGLLTERGERGGGSSRRPVGCHPTKGHPDSCSSILGTD